MLLNRASAGQVAGRRSPSESKLDAACRVAEFVKIPTPARPHLSFGKLSYDARDGQVYYVFSV
jgi:hypothetical protein